MSKPSCPVHNQPTPTSIKTGWPPGPTTGYTGWGLLRQLRQDFLGSFQTWQQQYGQVVHIKVWPEHEIILTDPQLVRELLVTHQAALVRWEHAIQVFSQIDGHSVFTTEGERWKQKQVALQPSFSLQNSRLFIPQMVAATEQALSQWTNQPQSIESLITSLTMDVIVRLLFSTSMSREEARLAEQAVHTVLVHANAEFYWPVKLPDWLPWKWEKRQALKYLHQFIQRQIQARLALTEADWPQDLLAQLLNLHRQDPKNWSLDAVQDECMTLFLAGHETTAATLVWWVWCMATHPALQNQARKEVQHVLGEQAPKLESIDKLEFVHQTLKETMRLYPAAPTLLTRRTTQAIQLGSWQFPARTLFIVPVYLIQRDAEWFTNPLAFEPERFSQLNTLPRGTNLPFGIGPRVCLGQHLATTEMQVIAAMILQRFNLALTQAMQLQDIKAVFNVSLRPDQSLPVRLEPLYPQVI